MGNGNAVQLAVRLDAADLQIGTEELVNVCESLNQSLSVIAQWDMNEILTSLNILTNKIDILATECMSLQGNGSFLTTLSESVGIVADLFAIADMFGESNKMVQLFIWFGKFLSTTLWPVLQKACTWIANLFSGSTLGAILGIVVAIALVVTAVIDNFNLIKERFVAIWDEHIKPIWDRIVLFAENLKIVWDTVIMPIIDWVYQVLEPIIMTVLYGIIDAIEVVASFVKLIFVGVIDVVDGIIQFVTSLLTGDWEKMWDGIIKIIRGALETIWGFFTVMINGCAWVINTVISAIYSLIAGIVNAVGGVLSAVGKWFGLDLGGWHMEPMNEPFIPYLAQGAVLPANKPFLAMVGDQRHGTNVEAPLATIQEAVALVMEDQFNGMMAGFEAVTARQEQILETLMGIEIGDTTIGQAAMRYNRKMAIIKGGM